MFHLRGVWLALVAAVVASFAHPAVASHLRDYPQKHRIVYQLDDGGADKAKFVLGNIRNHLNGVGGQNIESMLRSSLWKLPGSGVISSGFLPDRDVYIGFPYSNCT